LGNEVTRCVSPKTWVPVAAILLGLVLWEIDAVADAWIFGEGTVLSQTFAPEPIEVWMRSLQLVVLLVSGVVLGRVIAQREQLQEILRNTERLHTISTLAAGIAHEINNPLTYVRANLGLLKEHWATAAQEMSEDPRSAVGGVSTETEELIDEALHGVDRVCAIISDVKALSQPGTDRRERVDLNVLIDHLVALLSSHLETVEVERHDGAIPSISGNPQQLQQLFLNLLMNARHASEAGGKIRIATEAVGSDVVVRVQDEGSGIQPDLIARIFDPFFTTKPVGEGTGLGLAIAAEIARNHGGEIRVASEPGFGATFRVRLPARAKRREASHRAA
jgi:signal transduction histidine kinase